MQESDLLPGDLIFFLDSFKIPQHIAIYNGVRDGVPFVSHAVTGKYNAVMTTRLKVEEGPYVVMRCKNMDLALAAQHRMRIWGENGIPYSFEKSDLIQSFTDEMPYCHPKEGPKAGSILAQKYYEPNFYRYIEYASHPNMPFHPNYMEGFRCDEAIVAAFNVETLLQDNCILAEAFDQVTWVSDRLCEVFEEELTSFSLPYQHYLKWLASGYEYNDGPIFFYTKPTARIKGLVCVGLEFRFIPIYRRLR